MITITIQGKNAAEIRQELKSLLAEAAAKKKEFKPAPISVSAEAEKTEADPAAAPEKKPVTITEVRQALKDTADAFGLEAAQEILHKYAPKLADLSADKYDALLAELQEKLE